MFTRLNASPIYTITFLSAYFYLQRPCVYCSILLFVLVFSIFDFSADWFEPRWNMSTSAVSETAAAYLSGNATLTEVVLQTAVSVINGTGGSLASAAMGGVMKRKAEEGNATSAVITSIPSGLNAFEWLRTILDKKQYRIQCLGVVVRI